MKTSMLMAVLRDATAMRDGQTPEWIHLAPRGLIVIEDGQPLLLGDAEAASVLSAFAALGHDMVVDYEHQTLTGGRAPAAGWIKELDWRADGLWGRTEWTEEGARLIAKREYRYHSPVFLHRADRRVAQLYNVALTNQPRMRNVAALAAKHVINPDQGAEEMNLFEKLKKLLGLADAASEADAVTAVEALKADKDKLAQADKELTTLKSGMAAAGEIKLVACKDVLDSLGLDQAADAAKVVAAIEALKAPAVASGEMGKQLATLSRTVEEMKAEGLVAEALKDGKASPAEMEAWGRKMAAGDPALFRAVVLSRQRGSVVPVDGMPTADGLGGKAADEMQMSINKMCGIGKETWEKFGPRKEDK
ncbi:phage protease [Desulfovibrio aminophilus]|uniref:phage protease n=1 Tax=Desulfovibrio aminophilus TaxID=81425 RepID=UPI0012EC0B32|nr:phage protease [Desulfovibrio aminophilus]